MNPIAVRNFTATSCLGSGRAKILEALLAQRSGLERCRFESVDLDTYIGEAAGLDDVPVAQDLARFDCRNNRLAELALRQDGFIDSVQSAASRWSAERIGVFLGTSTSGILQTEIAYRHREPDTGALPADFDYAATHNSFSVADYVRHRLGLRGPAMVISCACASSAKVFGSARRMLEAGLIDAALVGGVDSLCLTTLYGFHSLQLSSAAPCRPFDVRRDGISIGEAAAFALVERSTEPQSGDQILLLGIGESSDAYHMSAPHPQGAGARRAMQSALQSADLAPEAIDYINLHGTGTPSNDLAESHAVVDVFGSATPASSTKGATGHTLGAAGALEAVVCMLALQSGLLPGGVHTSQIDPALGARYLMANRRAPVGRVMSNSFGFGGTNCSLIFGRAV
ncbi:MAG: beta-ketoacyl-[acyl-carrier-protein] synthase family protein [Steroidobacteraceae bacterium]